MGIKKNYIKFVNINSEGFYLFQSLFDKIIFTVTHTSYARKLWNSLHGKRYLSCFSSDGVSSSQEIPCDERKTKNKCIKKFRLFFYKGIFECCLELNPTSYENYLQYTNKLKQLNLSINEIKTQAFIVNHGYWNEIFFELYNSLP